MDPLVLALTGVLGNVLEEWIGRNRRVRGRSAAGVVMLVGFMASAGSR